MIISVICYFHDTHARMRLHFCTMLTPFWGILCFFSCLAACAKNGAEVGGVLDWAHYYKTNCHTWDKFRFSTTLYILMLVCFFTLSLSFHRADFFRIDIIRQSIGLFIIISIVIYIIIIIICEAASMPCIQWFNANSCI